MIREMSGLFLLLSVVLGLSGCQKEVAPQQEIQTLEQELKTAKTTFKEALNKKENPVLEIVDAYRQNEHNKSPFVQEDLELGYKRMIERFTLFREGKLSEAAYYADVNGAFEANAPFKTDIGKRISEYYAKRFQEKRPGHDDAFEKYMNVQHTKKEINDLKQSETDE